MSAFPAVTHRRSQPALSPGHTWHLSALNTAEVDALVDPTGTRARVFGLAAWSAATVAAVVLGATLALVL